MNKTFKIMLASCALCTTTFGCTSAKTPDFREISSICELAVYKCDYHTVGTATTEGTAFLSINYKRIWMEYTSEVELGIDASKVTVSQPDKNNVVTVTIPDAEIISIYTDPDSFGDVLVDTGFLTGVSADEKLTVYNQSVADLKTEITENSDYLTQAKERAKSILKNYILNVGEQIGQKYTIEWKDAA